jgi:hypothetical protein
MAIDDAPYLLDDILRAARWADVFGDIAARRGLALALATKPDVVIDWRYFAFTPSGFEPVNPANA